MEKYCNPDDLVHTHTHTHAQKHTQLYPVGANQ